MQYRLYISLFAVSFFLSQNIFSQEIDADLVNDSVLYKKSYSFGAIAHTLGFGLRFQKGENITIFKSKYYEFQFVGMKSPKQIRTINPFFTNAKSYVYGKLNHVYMLRGGVGMNRLLNRKPYWGGVELRYTFSGGASIGIAKPVYLYILEFTGDPFEYDVTTEKYDPGAHFFDNIYGRAPFTKGFDEIKIYPGIYGKVGLDFEIGAYKSKVNSVEIGGILEYFPKAIPIMAFNNSKHVFFTGYISYSFGKRYNSY